MQCLLSQQLDADKMLSRSDLKEFILKYKWYLIGGSGILLLGGGTAAVIVIRSDKGRRLTKSTLDNAGFIIEDPYVLSGQAGLKHNVYSLARVISSETGGSDNIQEKTWVGWVVKNQAAYKKKSITEIVIFSKRGSGRYGQQAQGRFVGSSKDPYERDADVAKSVIASNSDPTNGATRFLHYNSQLSNHRNKGHDHPDEVLTRWQGEGFIVAQKIDDAIFLKRSA